MALKFDYGPEMLIWGDERWGVTTHRLLIPTGDRPLWAYHRGSYHYSLFAIENSTGGGHDPTFWESLWGQRPVLPTSACEIKLQVFRQYREEGFEAYGTYYPEKTRHGLCLERVELPQRGERIVEFAKIATGRHRAAHIAFLARVSADAKTKADYESKSTEQARLATIRNLPRLPEGS